MKNSRASARAAIAAAISSSPTPRIPTWGRASRRRPDRAADGSTTRFRTRAEFLDSIEAKIVKQDIVDIMLTSASNLEQLVKRGAFAARRQTGDPRQRHDRHLAHRGATITKHRRRAVPHRLAVAVRHGSPNPQIGGRVALTDLGLYSITFTNVTSTPTSPRWRRSASSAPTPPNDFANISSKCSTRTCRGPLGRGHAALRQRFDRRCLAGLTEAERPRFLKIAYNGPRALDELASFDPGLVVGVLGGGAGTTRDCFELIHQAEKYGARVALFGRKINLAESPLDIVRFMRAVADGDVSPKRGGRGLSRRRSPRPGSSRRERSRPIRRSRKPR
jgi:hypothetical protein